MAPTFDRRELALRVGRERRHVRAGDYPSQSPSQMKVGLFRSVEASTLGGEDADRATLFRFASFLPLDRAPVFYELRPDEVHERAHAS
jgi:hypothetical protein